jgi:hypothetical protein
VGSLAPQSVFQSANGVLHFALELISFAFAFELAVAGYLSDNFLQFALGLLSRALDAIFVHHNGLQYFERSRIIDRGTRYATEISDRYYTDTAWPSRLCSPPYRTSSRLEAKMKTLIGCAAVFLILATATSAEAKGCIKGALVGGTAGHFAGHHGLLGAAAGCVIGRHQANKRAKMQHSQTGRGAAQSDWPRR